MVGSRDDGQHTFTRNTFDYMLNETTNVQAHLGVKEGEFALVYKLNQIEGFDDLAKVWDQIRVLYISVQFHWHGGSDAEYSPYAGLFAYDPDGYSTSSGSVRARNNALAFTVSPYKSSQTFTVIPGTVVSGMVKKQQWFDIAASSSVPIYNIGAVNLMTGISTDVTQLSVRTTFKITFELKGAR